jgi:hypothetical protein
MIILIAILLLFAAAGMISALHFLRPAFAHFWLVATGGALSAWLLVLFSRPQVPYSLPLGNWQPRLLLPISPSLLIDPISWSLVLALVTINLATILTDVVRPRQGERLGVNWAAQTGYLVLTGAGSLAVLAGNLLTLLLAWAALDLLEMMIWQLQARQPAEKERVIAAFAARLTGIGLVMWVVMATYANGQSLSLENLVAGNSHFLLAAAGLRLGVLPLNTPLPRYLPEPAGLRVVLWLAPTATNLALLVRSAEAGIVAPWAGLFPLLAGFAALYGGITWGAAKSAQSGLPAWIVGMAALALGAATHQQPQASLAWGLCLLFCGSLLGLASARPRRLRPLLLLAALGMSALPFTPTWPGVLLYTAPFQAWMVLFLLAQALLLAGFLRHAWKSVRLPAGAERWVWLLYPCGLTLLILVQWATAWWLRPAATDPTANPLQGLPGLFAAWPGFAVAFLVALSLVARELGLRIPSRLGSGLQAVLGLEWLYRLVWIVYRAAGRIAAWAGHTLEGPAGVLWALLILVLLISLFVQFGMGV